nr:TetR/AcrR family transcriptional regulator [Sphingomonas sp. SCN 67-18]
MAFIVQEMDEVQACGADRREDRRRAILDAAEALFLDQGFERTSLAAIVKCSGGSLATLYEHFSNKRGLLRAVLDRRRDENLDDHARLIDAAADPADALRALAHWIHDYFIDPRSVAMMRIMIGESLRDPQFARDLHRDVHLVHVHKLAEVFRRWTAEGKARFEDADAAAELYFATVMCNAELNAMLDAKSRDAVAASRAQIEWRLEPFLAYFLTP